MTTPTREALLDTIRQLADRAIPVVAQRNAAYAGGGDVFGNLNLIETLSSGDIRTETGIVIRMGDKVSRLYSLTARNAPENDESLEDTLVDLLGYSALLLLRHRTRLRQVPGAQCSIFDDTLVGENIREQTIKWWKEFLPAKDAIWAATEKTTAPPADDAADNPTYKTVRKHAYAWDGTIPCTGSYRCHWCKKVADATGTDYSKVDYNEPCPGSPA